MMKLFSDEQYRGLLILVPIAILLVMLAVLIEFVKPPKLIPQLMQYEQSLDTLPLKHFDPNVATYDELRSSGVPREAAVGIVRWRKYGKVYRIKEDLALVSGVTDSLYGVLEPYIVIADSLAAKPWKGLRTESEKPFTKPSHREHNSFNVEPLPNEPFMIDTASAKYLSRWGLSMRQAEVVIRYRDSRGGIFNQEELRACYVVDDEVADAMMPYIHFPERVVASAEKSAETAERFPLEINSADSAQLVAVRGIGAKSAGEIVKYRNLLGGYHSVEQISELKCVTEENFVQILQQICCDSCKIQKIDINFAPPKEVARHPYVSSRALRRIIKQRQLKGGWSRIEEMVEDEILSEDEAKRLAPYLWFRLDATE